MEKKRICEACGKGYRPLAKIQKYCTKKCKNRAAQKRLRERAKGR